MKISITGSEIVESLSRDDWRIAPAQNLKIKTFKEASAGLLNFEFTVISNFKILTKSKI